VEALEAAIVTMRLRELEGEDWEALRDLRLHALETELGRFFRSPSEEREKSEDEWRALAAGDERHQLFGLFDGDVLVGMTGVVADADDPSGATASLGMSYVKPEYRGRGFGARYYEARLAWARARPQFTRAVVGHRRSNAASRHLIERFGFRWIEDLPHRWPDGAEEDDVCYELPLR
jgi:RimJ/RimL family protein N-acetyltransferase